MVASPDTFAQGQSKGVPGVATLQGCLQASGPGQDRSGTGHGPGHGAGFIFTNSTAAAPHSNSAPARRITLAGSPPSQAR